MRAHVAPSASLRSAPPAYTGKEPRCAILRRRGGPEMIDEIVQHHEELHALCRRYHVRRLDVFGSAARGDFDPERSDVDFLVEFDRGHPDALSLKTYFDFKDALEALLGRPVDLVEPGAVQNPYLRASIDASREPLFAA